MNKEQYTSDVCSIAHEAGKLLIELFGKEQEYTNKPDGSFVTDADYKVEHFVTDKLKKLIPEAGFLAEESGKSGNHGAEYNWIIDPIDGTTNFARGFPYFSINIALVHNDQPIVGVTYAPALDELFCGHLGGGATWNGKPMKVSGTTDLKKSVCSLGVPCRSSDCNEFYDLTKNLQDNVHTIRKLGSASLDIANIAAGRFDGSMLKYVSWWDIAAGIVLVREAGGMISEFDGGEISPDFNSCLASNGVLHKQFLDFLS